MKTIILEHPIPRGDNVVDVVAFIEPKGTGWLRDVKLFDLLQMDVAALTTVLPRITDPALTVPEIRTQLHPADFIQLGAEVAAFLAPKSMTQETATP